MLFDQGSTASGNVRSGKMRGLVVSGRNRMASLPDVPGFAEAGLKDFDIANATGLLGPAALPAPIVQRLHAAAVKALGCNGAIVGRALYENRFTLPQAIAAAA
jgi:tripartite-type tricarboxylate transporter receptor subunit TctC